MNLREVNSLKIKAKIINYLSLNKRDVYTIINKTTK